MLKVNEYKNDELTVKPYKGTSKKSFGPTEFVKCKSCRAVLREKGIETREFCDYVCKRNYKIAHPEQTVKKMVKEEKEWFYKKWD